MTIIRRFGSGGRLAAVLLLAGSALPSCKAKAPDSGVQSLDNMARTSNAPLTLNDCSGDNAMSDADFAQLEAAGQIAVEDASLAPALRRALSAAPKSLQRTYFGMGYQLRVTSAAASLCSAAEANPYMATDLTETNGTQTLTACWLHQIITPPGTAPGGKVNEIITTVIDAQAQTVAHSTLRTLAYAVADRFAYMSSPDGKSLTMELTNANTGFTAARTALTVAALSDKAGQGDAFSAYQNLMPPGVLTTHATAIATIWQAWLGKNAATARRFENAVFAEALDSEYCSAATNKAMQTGFPQAYAYFNQVMVPNLNTLTDIPLASSTPSPSVNAPQDASLALANGCGFFNRLCGGGIGSGCGLFGRLCSSTATGPLGGCGFFGRLCGGGIGSGCGLFGLLCGGGGPFGDDDDD